LKWLTFDRALLIAVLSIQVGMAGWFYAYYTTQQQQHTTKAKADNLTPASLRPVGHFNTPLQPFSSSLLNHQMRARQIMDTMQARVRQGMQAFERMQNSLMSDDLWSGINMSPTMDMREYNDRYELTFSHRVNRPERLRPNSMDVYSTFALIRHRKNRISTTNQPSEAAFCFPTRFPAMPRSMQR